MDINGWFEDLTNIQLKKYGLIKPIAYEQWHVQLTEMTWISEATKNSCQRQLLNESR
jgi:hypothetical protein